MKVLLFTDNLGSGGAQRQLVMLAEGLQKRGHDVVMCTYAKGSFFQDKLVAANVKWTSLPSCRPLLRPWYLMKVISAEQPQAVISFLDAANLYAELSSIYRKRWKLIVSERSSVPNSDKLLKHRLFRQFHRIADKITTNSDANREMIENSVHVLKRKCYTIYNAVDIEDFRPSDDWERRGDYRFVVFASHKPAKNFVGLAKAVKLLIESGQTGFRIDWYGSEVPGWTQKNRELAKQFGVDNYINIYPETHQVADLLRNSDAMILPSLWEGLSNTLCEALASGCPVLTSNVSDNARIVRHQSEGYIFNPCNYFEIAGSMRSLMSMSDADIRVMRRNARQRALELFAIENYVDSYEELIS